jgi:hypothetical protein
VDETEARIRQDIEQTRAAMSEKIGLLQDRMEETVEETGATVAKVVNGVLEQVKRVQGLIEHVTSTVDATVAQVEATAQQTTARGAPGEELIAELYQRPWVMMGTAVLLGYILGSGRRSPAPQGLAPGQAPSRRPQPDATSDNLPSNPRRTPTSSPPANAAATSAARVSGPAGTPSV